MLKHALQVKKSLEPNNIDNLCLCLNRKLDYNFLVGFKPEM